MSSSPSDFLKLFIVYILIKDVIFFLDKLVLNIHIYVSFFISDTICKMQVNKKNNETSSYCVILSFEKLVIKLFTSFNG